MRILRVLRPLNLVLLAASVTAAQTAAPPKPAGQAKPAAPKPAAAKAKPAAAKAKPAAAPAKPALEPGLYATITTTMGPITFRMYEKESPITVQNFVDLATGRKEFTDPETKQRVKRPFYNGLLFHRVIPNFMIQGGDPTGTGMGGSDEIADEFHPSLIFDRPGRVAMANTGAPRSGSSQFFITDVPTPHLNGRHPIFGQVVDGMAVVEKIVHVPANEENRPKTPVKMLRVSFKRVGPGPQPPTSGPAKPATAKPKAAKPKPAAPAAVK
jgi:peptidyl-prolyl cis-trans isomerase A (cyclophilin A)